MVVVEAGARLETKLIAAVHHLLLDQRNPEAEGERHHSLLRMGTRLVSFVLFFLFFVPNKTSLRVELMRTLREVAFDPRDISENQERNKQPKLTLMEEILLLGLKDKQVRFIISFMVPWF